MAEYAPKLTKSDRDALLRLAKERANVAKTAAKRRSADLLAEFEVEMQSRHKHQENEVFSRVRDVMSMALESARLEIEKECDRLGIPKRFRPRIVCSWDPGGAMEKEYKFLRFLAEKQAKSQEMEAAEKIERDTVDVQTGIYAGSLDSEAAAQILAGLPNVSDLLPPLRFRDVQELFARTPERLIAEYNQSREQGRDWGGKLSIGELYALAPPDSGKGGTVTKVTKSGFVNFDHMDDDDEDDV